MALEVLNLLHHLIEDLLIVLRGIASSSKTEEDFLIKVCTYLLVVEPVGKGRLHINEFLNLLSQSFTLIIDYKRAHKLILTIDEVVFISQVHQDVVKGFLFEGQAQSSKALLIFTQLTEQVHCLSCGFVDDSSDSFTLCS